MASLMTDLDALPLLAKLSPTQRAAIAGISTTRTYPPGHRLFDEGSLADRCWIVLTGHVAVDMLDPPHGERVVVRAVGPGELLGWSWTVPFSRRLLGATVVSPTRTVVAGTRSLRALTEDDPALGYQLSLIQFDALLVLLGATRAWWLNQLRGSP